jgi:hypothetical protein
MRQIKTFAILLILGLSLSFGATSPSKATEQVVAPTTVSLVTLEPDSAKRNYTPLPRALRQDASICRAGMYTCFLWGPINLGTPCTCCPRGAGCWRGFIVIR